MSKILTFLLPDKQDISNMVNEMFVDMDVELFEDEECKVFTMALNCFYYNGET